MGGYITTVIAGFPVEDMHNKQIDVSSHGGQKWSNIFQKLRDVPDPAEVCDRIAGAVSPAGKIKHPSQATRPTIRPFAKSCFSR